jgi:hypothetical protein
VRYDEFRDQLEAALQRNSLHFHGLQRVETIELANTVRHWKVYAHGAAPPSTEPFHVSAEIDFAWSPFDAARSHAREEDLLTELIGRKKRLPRTERRWTRVDLWLHARLPYGSTTAMPEPQLFGAGPHRFWRRSMEPLPKSRRRRGALSLSLARTKMSTGWPTANPMASFRRVWRSLDSGSSTFPASGTTPTAARQRSLLLEERSSLSFRTLIAFPRIP